MDLLRRSIETDDRPLIHHLDFPDDLSSATPETNKENDRSAQKKGRDVLLLKCRDAIEELHREIEEERAVKSQL